MSSVNIPPSALPPSGAASGELGGNYPGPTVNATHSGSAHHTAFVQADHDALANPHHSNANDHAAAHTLTSHSTRAHSELTGIGATDHHSNANDHANTNDPTTNQKLALAGTGTPSGTDKYVNDSDARMTNARTPTGHHTTHEAGGTDIVSVTAAVAIVVTEQDFGSTPVSYAEFAIADANVLVGSDIHVQLLSEAPAAQRDGVTADADEAEMEPMAVWASGISAGSFTLVADVIDGPVTGPYKFGYLIG